MGLEKIKFVYIKTDSVLVCKGLGDLSGIIVQANTVNELRQQILDSLGGYLELFPDSMKKITKKEWRKDHIHVDK